MIITPIQFKDAFLQAIILKECSIIDIWNDVSQRTRAMLDLLPEIGKLLNLQVYSSDYYTLDAIFYTDKHIVNFPESTTYAKYIAIAIEIENRIYGSQVEMNKLQIYNTPLKVLVTYSGNDSEKEDYLKMYSRIITDSDIFGDISNQKIQLVIFGSCDGKNTNWTFHVYDNQGFKRI